MKLSTVLTFSSLLGSSVTEEEDRADLRLPVIYPSSLYLTVPPRKDVMFKCKVKSNTNISISWSFKNKNLISTTNRR